MAPQKSPFLHAGSVSEADKLSIIHLKRDLQLPTVLKNTDEDDEGYAEGKVVNTRFGSFPHSTLIGLPWGTQVRASKVDTGSRGRRGDKKLKRTRDPESSANAPDQKYARGNNGDRICQEQDGEDTPTDTKGDKEPIVAQTGFIHLLPPTPENWTSSLPHRTQVVYTPDYSYVLHRIRARPGTNLIEAGAGSGSFTHASSRAVYSGNQDDSVPAAKRRRIGKVWSYEFHEPRHGKLVEELHEHGLDGLVEVTHRDVCKNGFLVNGESPKAEAIFLDLPAPWLALPHLTRSPQEGESGCAGAEDTPFVSALNPETSAYICTFSPCIEQVQRTVSVMRKYGWVDIEMVEISQKRFEVRRERIGIDNALVRGFQTQPATVEEALARLTEVEGKMNAFHENGMPVESRKKQAGNPRTKEKIIEGLVEKKLYLEGKLTHRTEPELKTHTSYLVFAVLPREWSAEDEANAREKWAVAAKTEEEIEEKEPTSRRQLKKAARQSHKTSAAERTSAALESNGDVVTTNGQIGEVQP